MRNLSPRGINDSSRGAVPLKNFVSRAENKLKDANSVFKYDFRNKTVLDIGSSTGGFTEYVLNKGAKRVIAVEIGTNQMKTPLRFDQRIDLREKTDFFKTHAKDYKTVDAVVADVSFVSLKQILKHAKNILPPKVDYLVMLKPQFEAKRGELKRGVIKNNTIRRNIMKDFESWLSQNGFIIINKRDNSLKGRFGNEERFYYLKLAK